MTGELDSQGTVPTGDGPYSLAIDPMGEFLYAAHFKDGTVSQYAIAGKTLMLISTMESGQGSKSVAVHPTGNWVYVANAGADTISLFEASGG